MAKQGGSLKLHGRFPPGSTVRLVEVEGPHVLRPGPHHETVDTQEVDKDGVLEFSKAEAGKRYFAVGYANGLPREVRLTGKADADEGFLAGYEPVAAERVRLSDGSFLDEEPERKKQDVPEGATWQAQHHLPEGTLQRSNTPRGSAYPISAEELERAHRQWRKQEPTEPIVEAVEASEDPETAPARTSKPAAKSPATTSTSKTSKGN